MGALIGSSPMSIGTLAMVRLLAAALRKLHSGQRATYLLEAERSSAAALRRKVAEPSGFAGLELGDMGYETLPAPVRRALHVHVHVM